MKPRILSLPRVENHFTESVCVRISVDADDFDYFRIRLAPDEAISLATDMLNDALRAKACIERRKWLAKIDVR